MVQRRGGRRTGARQAVRRRGLEGRQQTVGEGADVAADVEDDADAVDVDTTWCARRWSTRFQKKGNR